MRKWRTVARNFPPAPMVWTKPDGTLTADARRFLMELFNQLGGNQPLDISVLKGIIASEDKKLFWVAGL